MYLAFSPKNKFRQTEVRTKMMERAKEVKSFLTAIKMKQNDEKNIIPHFKYCKA